MPNTHTHTHTFSILCSCDAGHNKDFLFWWEPEEQNASLELMSRSRQSSNLHRDPVRSWKLKTDDTHFGWSLHRVPEDTVSWGHGRK